MIRGQWVNIATIANIKPTVDQHHASAGGGGGVIGGSFIRISEATWPSVDLKGVVHQIGCYVISVTAQLIYLNFQPLEVVSRYRDSQPQAVGNYSYLFNLRPNIKKSWYADPTFKQHWANILC